MENRIYYKLYVRTLGKDGGKESTDTGYVFFEDYTADQVRLAINALTLDDMIYIKRLDSTAYPLTVIPLNKVERFYLSLHSSQPSPVPEGALFAPERKKLRVSGM